MPEASLHIIPASHKTADVGECTDTIKEQVTVFGKGLYAEGLGTI